MSDVLVSAEAARLLPHSLARLGADPARLAGEVGLDMSRLPVPGWVGAERLLDDALVGAHVGLGQPSP